MKGNSFANGESVNNGPNGNSGPYAGPAAQGWDIRPLHTIWDGTEGRLPR